jgi:hypothetical protein
LVEKSAKCGKKSCHLKGVAYVDLGNNWDAVEIVLKEVLDVLTFTLALG